jgi:hypothetical protein
MPGTSSIEASKIVISNLLSLSPTCQRLRGKTSPATTDHGYELRSLGPATLGPGALDRVCMWSKMTRLDEVSCLICTSLVFGCVVAKKVWGLISRSLGLEIGADFESMARCWLCNKKFGIVNMMTAAFCWSLWKLRNNMCLQGVAWSSMSLVW